MKTKTTKQTKTTKAPVYKCTGYLTPYGVTRYTNISLTPNR